MIAAAVTTRPVIASPWRAALDGSALSNPDKDARNALDDAGATLDAIDDAGRPAGDLAGCIQAAAGDAAKIQACTG